MMNKGILVLVLLIICASPLINSSGEEVSSVNNSDEFVEVTIDELVSNPKTYNGQIIMLEGFVDKVEYTKIQ